MVNHLALASCALLLTGACTAGTDSNEDPLRKREEPFRIVWFGADHNDITEEALHFLTDDAADQVGDYNEDIDGGSTKLQSKYHVDNCRVQEAFDTIRERYDAAVVALNPASPQGLTAMRLFGGLTHTIQDFYAHSNWVEGGQTALVASGGFKFPSTATGQMLGGMMVITESLPFSYTIDLASGSRVPVVQLAGSSRTDKGLITGTFADNNDPTICPLEADIAHGDDLSQGAYGTFLAKDDPDSPHHGEAKALAVRQTTEEFCRLARLVMLRYGNPGLDFMLSTFRADRTGYLAACPKDRSLVASVFMSAI